jgi:hypothetical protein
MTKHIIRFCLFIVLLSSGVLAQSREDQVLMLSSNKFNWMIHKQYDSLWMVLHENVRYIHSNGWVQNKQEVIDDFKSGKLVLKSVQILESSIRLFDRMAIVIGRGNFSGVMSGSTFDVPLFFTEVYVIDEENKWKLISRHANRLP